MYIYPFHNNSFFIYLLLIIVYPHCSLESVDGWSKWIHNCICIVEHAWSSADLQLQLSIYLLTGVVVLWLLIGMAWWMYGEAISSLFELKSMNFG